MRGSHILCVVIGAVATALATPLFRSDQAPAARGERGSASGPRVEDLVTRLAELEARAQADGRAADEAPAGLDELAARLGAMERQIAAERVAQAAEDVGEPASAPEAQRIRAVLLTGIPEKTEEAIAAWTRIAESTADPERQADAYFEIGQLRLKQRNPKDAALAYARVVDLVGLGEARGQVAAQHAGICEYQCKDTEAAYRMFRRLAEAPTMMHSTAPTIRHWAAVLAAKTGDTEYARRELRRYIEDYDREGYEAFHDYVEGARRLLSELQ